MRLTMTCLAVAAMVQTLPSRSAAAADTYHMPNILNVALVRQSDNSGEGFLRLSTTVNQTGCPKVGNIMHDVSVNGPYLDIVIKGYTTSKSALPREPHFSCKQTVQYASADIPLDRKLIEDNKIKTIRMVLDRGMGGDYYDVTLDKNAISITPQSQTVFKPARRPYGGQAALQIWYYPANTLILSAPTAPAAHRADTIAAYAESAGLTPLETLLPGFSAPAGQDVQRYYVDAKGTLAKKISPQARVPVNDVIVARLPGLYE